MILADLPGLILEQTAPVPGRRAALSSRERPGKIRGPFHPIFLRAVTA